MRKNDELSQDETCMLRAHPNEMVFVLLSRDAAAPAAIRAWVAERVRLGRNFESDPQIVEALECASTMEVEGRKWVDVEKLYPPGLADEARLLYREYNALIREAANRGIVLVPGGENLSGARR